MMAAVHTESPCINAHQIGRHRRPFPPCFIARLAARVFSARYGFDWSSSCGLCSSGEFHHSFGAVVGHLLYLFLTAQMLLLLLLLLLLMLPPTASSVV